MNVKTGSFGKVEYLGTLSESIRTFMLSENKDAIHEILLLLGKTRLADDWHFESYKGKISLKEGTGYSENLDAYTQLAVSVKTLTNVRKILNQYDCKI